MKAYVNFELETPEDFAAFVSVFGTVVKSNRADVQAEPIRQPAPEPEKRIAAPVDEKPAKPAKAAKAKPVDPEPVDPQADAIGEDETEVEEIDKALVARELRAFMAERGSTGPKDALAVLKKFGVTTFDALPEESYAKFLSALKQ